MNQYQQGDAVARAALGIVEAAEALSSAQRVLVVSRGSHALWRTVVDRLRDGGASVAHDVRDELDRQWDPPAPEALSVRRVGRGARPGVDLLIHHDPFGPGIRAADPADATTADAKGGTDKIRHLVDSHVSLMFIDFPHGVDQPALRDRLEMVYLRALAEPSARLRDRFRDISGKAAGARALHLESGAGARLVIEAPWHIRDDWASARLDGPVLQMPFGEAWFACSPDRVRGTVRYVSGTHRGTTTESATVREGLFDHLPGNSGGARVVEVGIGLNARAPWLPAAGLFEKSLHHVHLGFGDNSMLGGAVRGAEHFDIALPINTTAWAVQKDGHRVRIA
ncbi:hypothetical protein ACFWAT_11880 [Streptomyces syringium]|uniref:hypothetical protein n=1 Tax=Streptomyces syringium TaxID=76729 RepID=UPI00366056EE